MTQLGVTYSQKPIRLQLSVVSNPPAPLVDANTGAAPRFWRGYPVSVQVGMFDADNNPVDLSDVTQLQLILMAGQLSPVSVASIPVLAANITPGIAWEDWQQGVDQNASFLVTGADSDQSLGGSTSAEYWMAIVGLFEDGTSIVYGAGNVEIYNPGNSLPFPAPGLVSFNEQEINGSSVFTIAPGSQIHVEEVGVGNTPGRSKGVVTAVGLIPGARVSVRFNLPAIAGTEIDLYDQSLSGSELFSAYSDPSGYTPTALFDLYFDGTNFKRLSSTIPANGQQS